MSGVLQSAALRPLAPFRACVHQTKKRVHMHSRATPTPRPAAARRRRPQAAPKPTSRKPPPQGLHLAAATLLLWLLPAACQWPSGRATAEQVMG